MSGNYKTFLFEDDLASTGADMILELKTSSTKPLDAVRGYFTRFLGGKQVMHMGEPHLHPDVFDHAFD